MKNSFLILLTILASCNLKTKEPPDPKNPAAHNPPTEPCKSLSWSKWSVGTHGYPAQKFDTVIVKTYVKNSKFDSLISTYAVLNNGEVTDRKRHSRSFSLPEKITTDQDLLIIMGSRDTFQITGTQTGWVGHMCNKFCGYECTITHYLMNGKQEGGGILLKNPHFEYQHEYIFRKRKELFEKREQEEKRNRGY